MISEISWKCWLQYESCICCLSSRNIWIILIISLNLTWTSCHHTSSHVVFRVQSQVILCKISGECSRKTVSSSALFFLGEVFVHSSIGEWILSVDTFVKYYHILLSSQTLLYWCNFKFRTFCLMQFYKIYICIFEIITFLITRRKISRSMKAYWHAVG